MGTLPSNLPEGGEGVALGLIAHMDTATETSGAGVRPRIVKDYDGGTIVLNEALGMTMGPDVYESLNKHLGEDLIVTDGTTLLGADNKAGVAEIMTLVGVSPDPPGGAPRQAVHRLHPGRGGGARGQRLRHRRLWRSPGVHRGRR